LAVGAVGTALLVMVGLAASVPGPVDEVDAPAPAPDLALRARTFGLARSTATLLWLGCVADFAHAAPRDGGRIEAAAIGTIAGRLQLITELDPTFSEAWTLGATMLRLLDGPDGPNTRTFVGAGRTARPDLAWSLIAPDAP
jgi:hypothetical protein